MFRKSTLLVAALALLLVAPQAHAAAKGDVSIGVGGGALIPLSEFKDSSKLGFLGGLDVDYMVTEAVSVGVDGMYSKNDIKDDFATANGIDKGNTSFFTGSGHLKYMFPMASESKIMPYVTAGGGVYHIKAEATASGVTASASENKFGGHGGAGVSFKAGSSLNVDVQGLFHVVSTTGTSTKFVTFRGGVSFPLSSGK